MNKLWWAWLASTDVYKGVRMKQSSVYLHRALDAEEQGRVRAIERYLGLAVIFEARGM
jgi:hypothetical protein